MLINKELDLQKDILEKLNFFIHNHKFFNKFSLKLINYDSRNHENVLIIYKKKIKR